MAEFGSRLAVIWNPIAGNLACKEIGGWLITVKGAPDQTSVSAEYQLLL